MWSIDTTTVLCRGLWPIQVLAAIDHFSRKVVCVAPLEGPNAGWIIEALECAVQIHGVPLLSELFGVTQALGRPIRKWAIGLSIRGQTAA